MSDEEASLKRSKGNNSNQQGFEEEVDNECCICLVDIAELKFIGRMDCCEHVVCWFCIQEWSHKIRACPICQRPFRKCKKTKAKRKKGRRRTATAAPRDKKNKKEPSLWQRMSVLSRRFSTAPRPAPARQWDDEDGNEEINANPIANAREDEEVVVAAAAGGPERISDPDSSISSNRAINEDGDGDGNNVNISDNSNAASVAGGNDSGQEEEAQASRVNQQQQKEEPPHHCDGERRHEGSEDEEGEGVGIMDDIF